MIANSRALLVRILRKLLSVVDSAPHALVDGAPDHRDSSPSTNVAPQSEVVEYTHDPIITVIVPAKDEGQYIRACLRSIQEQGVSALECVVVDDGSSDETVRIAQEFADEDERFRVVLHATPRGPSAARNTGLSNSSAPFVTFLDADDFLYEDSIRSRLDALLAAESDFVAGTYCDWQPTAHDQGSEPPDRAANKRGRLVGFVHGPECPFIVTSPIVRRSVLEQVGGFDEARPTAEDFDLWIRVLREGYTFVYVPIIGVAYRQKSTGLMFSHSAQHGESSMSIIERQYEDLSNEHDAPLLRRPLPYYELHCARARRLIRTYALAAASNEQDDVDRLARLIPTDLDVLARAGLDVDDELRSGVGRASRGIDGIDGRDVDRLVEQLTAQLRSRPSTDGAANR